MNNDQKIPSSEGNLAFFGRVFASSLLHALSNTLYKNKTVYLNELKRTVKIA